MVYKEQSHSPALRFTLRPANGYSNSIAISSMQIAYRTDCPIKDFPKDLEHLFFRLSNNGLVKVTIVVTLPEETLAHDSHEIEESLKQKFPQLVVRGGLHVVKKVCYLECFHTPPLDLRFEISHPPMDLRYHAVDGIYQSLNYRSQILPPPYYANPATNSSRFSRFIHDTIGQLANWDIWKEIKVSWRCLT